MLADCSDGGGAWPLRLSLINLSGMSYLPPLLPNNNQKLNLYSDYTLVSIFQFPSELCTSLYAHSSVFSSFPHRCYGSVRNHLICLTPLTHRIGGLQSFSN